MLSHQSRQGRWVTQHSSSRRASKSWLFGLCAAAVAMGGGGKRGGKTRCCSPCPPAPLPLPAPPDGGPPAAADAAPPRGPPPAQAARLAWGGMWVEGKTRRRGWEDGHRYSSATAEIQQEVVQQPQRQCQCQCQCQCQSQRSVSVSESASAFSTAAVHTDLKTVGQSCSRKPFRKETKVSNTSLRACTVRRTGEADGTGRVGTCTMAGGAWLEGGGGASPAR